MKRLLLAITSTWCAFYGLAQEATLQGRVLDAANGEPVIGANVSYAPGKGAATDMEGRYSFQLPAGEQEITVSFVGFRTHRENIFLRPGEVRLMEIRLNAAATQLDMVVVTAGRYEQRVGEVTQSLSVLRPEIVLNKNIVSLDAAMDQVPGVIVVDGEPQIRAGSGFSYGAGSRVQVLIDDIPILSGDIGRPNWTFLPIENLEQVEVIKGAASVLHGSAALSGVINVRTAYPRDVPRTRVTMFTGMYDAPERKEAKWWGENNPMISGVNFFHSRQIGNLDLVLGGNAFSDAGYIGPEPIPADSIGSDPLALGPGGYDNRIRFNTGIRWRNKKVEGLNYGVNANVMRSRSAAILIWEDVDAGLYRPQQGTVTRTLGTQYYIDPFIEHRIDESTRHSIRTRMHRQDFDNNNDQSNSNTVLHGEYQVQHEFDLFGETVVTAGAVYRHVASSARLYAGDEDGDGENTAIDHAGYLQLDKKLFGLLMLNGGVRYERFEVNDDVAERPVLRAGATYQLFEATFLRASYGQAFRFPTIGERFISTSVGQLRIFPNPDLRPETSTNLEGGLKQGFRIGGFQGYFDAVVFQQDHDDMVEFTFAQWEAATTDNFFGLGFKSVNTGSARVRGLELELAGTGRIGVLEVGTLIGYTATEPVSTTPDHVYADPVSITLPNSSEPFYIVPPPTFNNTSFDPTGNILKFRVQRLFRADVQLGWHKYFFGVSARYNSHVRNIDLAFADQLEVALGTGINEWMREHRTGDTIFDLRAGTDLTDQVRLTFIVNNLFNREYAIRPLAIEAPRNFQAQLMFDI